MLFKRNKTQNVSENKTPNEHFVSAAAKDNIFIKGENVVLQHRELFELTERHLKFKALAVAALSASLGLACD